MGRARPKGWCFTQYDARGNLPDTDSGAVSQSIQDMLGWMEVEAQRLKIEPPLVLSACRSRAMQNEMIRRWDRGERAGLLVRPSPNSKHIPDRSGRCRAVDLANSEAWLRLMGPRAEKKFPYIEWGGNYLSDDFRHFEERG